MTLFCGIYTLNPARPYPAQWRLRLENDLSRSGIGKIFRFHDERLFLLKLDVEAFPDSAWEQDPSRVTTVCGNPLLPQRSQIDHRGADVNILHDLSVDGLSDVLRRSRGSFCLAQYHIDSGRLMLATDRLGARPIYWVHTGEAILFAGALRLIESLPGLPLSVDFRGAIETAVFRQAFGERTAYHEISSLHGGRILEIMPSDHRVRTYWRWDADACNEIKSDSDELLRDLKNQFEQAVVWRIGESKSAFASLSGGLDSRCVVTQLVECGVEVHTVNSSWDGSLDKFLGRRYAEALGTAHHEVSLPPDGSGSNFFELCSQAMRAHAGAVSARGGHSRQLWGGNDGSISLGYVYALPSSISALRREGTLAGAEAFLRDTGFSLGKAPYRREIVERACQVPVDTVNEELSTIHCKDPGQRLYIFLTMNRQRRMMAPHFENIDRILVEPVEPFIDGEFLTFACKLPVDSCLQHRLYHRWLATFPPITGSVPWQAYPGHEACPLPMPAEARSQWEIARLPENQRKGRDMRKSAVKLLLNGLLAWRDLGVLLSLAHFSAVCAASAGGIQRSDYIIDQIRAIAPILRRCGGRVAGL